jgi:ribosome-associated toxin RatA of RatAB toxin-antitoxin module
MGNYRYAESADLSAERVFDYLADVRNLPHYLPAMTAAEPEGGDRVHVEAKVHGHTEAGEAWMRVDRERWRIDWGAEGPDEYRGELQISDDGPERCTIELDLHTVRAEGEEIENGVRQAVHDLIEAIGAKTDAGEP